MKTLYILILAAFFGLLASTVRHLPAKGAHDAPLQRDMSVTGSPGAGNYYLNNAYEDAHTVNVVTVVLGDYRAFDTLGETIVVFTAGAACVLILWRRPKS
ncbi:MAG: hydrogen gas-evolving membrane-bound hydrogenase subunit E [Verrucomicrobiota bacterium]